MKKEILKVSRWTYFCLLFLLLFATSISSIAQSFLKADGQRIVNETGQNVLLRGIGLGGWMLQEGYMLRVNGEGQQYKIRERMEALIGKEKTEEFYKAWLSNFITKGDIDSLKAWGFNSIRLPMHYRLYTLSVDEEPIKNENTWLEKGFALTDSLLTWCRSNKMYLILDMHAAPGGQGNDLNISDRDPNKPSLWESEANQKKLIALWQKLAKHYANDPWIGGYDIINEPNWGFKDPVKDKNGIAEPSNEPLKKLMIDITKAIREVDQKHIVIIEGNGWGNNYSGILPPWDDNLVLSFHKYWNYNNEESIKQITQYRQQYNIPVWLGETGENSNVWFTNAVRLVEENNIGWAWWPLKKLGLNNPLQIPINPGYESIIKYWRNGTDKPDAATAYLGLMQLAAQTNIRENLVHCDVIDALIRQPQTNSTLAFKKQSISNGSVVMAVDFDLGRNGFAYYDTDTANHRVSTGKNSAGNTGHAYRNDAVDIREMKSDPQKFYVTDMKEGEWLQYTLQFAEAGNHDLELKVSSPGNESNLVIEVNGKAVGNITILSTGEPEKWTTATLKNVLFTQGQNKIRIIVSKEGTELAEIRFTKNKTSP